MEQGRPGLVSRLVREPLVHFLILGTALFVLYGIVGDGASDRPDLVVVDETEIERLSEQFRRTWMRPPTRKELRGLAEDFVKEEILYREAVALGLDQDDLIIRRRMRQKMEFLNTDLVELAEPTDAELRAYLDSNADRFARPARYSFRQIYINPDRGAQPPEMRATALLGRLRADPTLGADPRSLGDPTMLPDSLESASAREISAVFGNALAVAIGGAERGAWSGPHPSSYGLHLIDLTEVEKGGKPTLEEVRAAVERDWSAERRQAANEAFYQALRERYRVEIRLPDSRPAETDMAASDR